MIYEFALEPELVVSWADRAAYRFFDGKFGIGGRRIASAFPAQDKWRELVVLALEAAFAHAEPAEAKIPCPQCAQRQVARLRLDALLGHLRKEMVERKGTMPTTWRDAIANEHRIRKFQGVLAAASPKPSPPLLCADEIDESMPAWNPPTPPTPRQVVDVVKALQPLLTFATEVRFVDPYLDASLPAFFEPLAGLVKVAQQRSNPAAVKLELHTGVKRPRVTGQSIKPDDIAREIVDDCRKTFAKILKAGTSLRVFVWSESVAGAEKIHNRYVLTNVGGVSVPSGLDRALPSQAHTDDFTVLSREQHEHRWTQYCEGGVRLKCVLGPQVVVGTA